MLSFHIYNCAIVIALPTKGFAAWSLLEDVAFSIYIEHHYRAIEVLHTAFTWELTDVCLFSKLTSISPWIIVSGTVTISDSI